MLDGTWKSTDTWEGIKDGMVVMAPFTNMPDDVKAMAEATTQKIAAGTLHPFTGPIAKQDGTTIGEPGKPLPDAGDPGDELVRQGHRRQASLIQLLPPINSPPSFR